MREDERIVEVPVEASRKEGMPVSKLLSMKPNKQVLRKYYFPSVKKDSDVVPNMARIRGLSKPNGALREMEGLGLDFLRGLRMGMTTPKKRRR